MSGSTRKPVRGLCISCEGYLSGPPINVSTVRRPANLPTTLRTVSNPSYLVTVVPAVNRSRHPAVNSHNEKYHGYAWPPFLAFSPSNFFPTHAMALIHLPFFPRSARSLVLARSRSMDHLTFSMSTFKYRRAGPRAVLSGVVCGVPCARSVRKGRGMGWDISLFRPQCFPRVSTFLCGFLSFPTCISGNTVNLRPISSRLGLKRRVTDDTPNRPLSASQCLLISDDASSRFFSFSSRSQFCFIQVPKRPYYEPD